MLLFEEETSDQRSILLVEIMNAIGFSKSEREIHRHYEHPRNVHMNIFRVAVKSTITIAVSTAEGMRGGKQYIGTDKVVFVVVERGGVATGSDRSLTDTATGSNVTGSDVISPAFFLL